MKNQVKMLKKTVFMLGLCLTMCLSSVAFAKTGSFKRSGMTAKAVLTGSGKTGGALTAITSGDITNVFAQVVACRSDGTYLDGNAQRGAIKAEAIFVYKKNNHKKFRGVHNIMNEGYRPYGNYYSHYINK